MNSSPPDSADKAVCRQVQVEQRHAGQRFDQAAADMFSDFSRSQLQQWIRSGDLRLDGRAIAKPNHRIAGTETLSLNVTLQAHSNDQPEAIELQVLYADEHLLMVNKSAGLVVHPGAGNPTGTLVNALLHRYPDLASLPRAGIVHRLDKLTSGVLMVARSDEVRLRLIEMLQARQVKRSYLALVWGQPDAANTINAPIGRHPVDRKRMTVHSHDSHNAKPAVTHYQVRQRYALVSLLDVDLQTGRTHQIRVHMQHIGFPLVGDPVYGQRMKKLPSRSQSRPTAPSLLQLQQFSRQALHAQQLRLQHPISGEKLAISAALPEDLQTLLNALDNESSG